MMTESKKRMESLSILQKLRQQGTPGREEKMDSMFDSLSQNEGEEDGEGDEELPEGEEGQEDNREQLPPPKKKPKLDAKKVEQFTKGFKSVF